ncbi:hypothetical protein [Elizabethkingia meningoseptica]|uniref:hypothetical protein n=1 Tax=Elizabethkingia meningoseptica TaxID=238 RepID=UPI00162AA080|nr:hypothetical protein [Elizabethkingia meningoseptica]
MAKENTKATPLTEEQLIQKEADLKAGEEKLANDRKEFEQEVQQLKEDKDQLVQKEAELDEREADIAKKEEDLEQLESDLLSTDLQPETLEPGYEFEHNGQKFKFTDDAPKSIRYKNKVWEQKELAKDEEAIAEFVNTSLIQKL